MKQRKGPCFSIIHAQSYELLPWSTLISGSPQRLIRDTVDGDKIKPTAIFTIRLNSSTVLMKITAIDLYFLPYYPFFPLLTPNHHISFSYLQSVRPSHSITLYVYLIQDFFSIAYYSFVVKSFELRHPFTYEFCQNVISS